MLLNISETHFKETSYESNISYYEDKNIVSDFDFVGVLGKKIEDIALKVMGEYGTKNERNNWGVRGYIQVRRDSNEMIFSKMLEQGNNKLIGGRYHLTGGVPF